TTQAPGKLGQAREFDGADDKVAAFVPVAGLTQWTIALWAEWQDGPKTYEHPIGLGTEHDATFWFSGTTLAFKAQDASGNTVIEKHLSWSIATGTWYHLAATFDGTTVKAYLDGVEKVSVVGTTTAIRSNSIRIGTSGRSEERRVGEESEAVLA